MSVTKSGGAEEDRTPDPLLAKQVLSQLSYSPKLLLVFKNSFLKLGSFMLINLSIGGPEGNRTTDLVLIRDAL